MKRLTFPLLLCGALVSLASAGLAQMTGTDATNAVIPAAEAQTPAATNSSPAAATTNRTAQPSEFETKIQVAREQRRQKDYAGAAKTLEAVLKAEAPSETHRQALFDLALVAEDNAEPVKAEQILAQYLHLYPQDPTVPDILLRQGLIYRQMGVHTLAVSKFYAVMSTALKLQLDNMDYYKKLVVRAQTEIAETYFLDAQFDEAAEYFNRILAAGDAEESREQLECNLIRSISHLTNYTRTIGKAQTFLDQFPKSPDVPEMRFLLASALKSMERNQDAMKQVLLLLQSEQENVNKDPDTWLYWQRRAGNEIANQLYKEGDFLDALQIYLSLADLDKSAAWQVPVWYQTGMVYEQLQQWQKATDTYTQILDRKLDSNDTNDAPMLSSLIDMAKWREGYIAWQQKARQSDLALHPPQTTNAPPAATP
ncbi:MAG: tetratricopeptide repeat protein [Verrucomicrobiota bacterium]|jgi:tetratricopeptide (TPR) repeat protein